ncbi:hypothetical protein MRB53_004001 [Persea americana]|uniref:Uncharacterized protein n=1 Tax=Persea americana TaxID=3435 RepID=A0ACC2MZB1_PERAE|nr:hypothetical protein MRB53_004001 [Persea americana]
MQKQYRMSPKRHSNGGSSITRILSVSRCLYLSAAERWNARGRRLSEVHQTGMASSPHHIDYDEDELDESYDPGGESDVFDNDFEIFDSEYANFQYETNDHAIINVEEAGLHTSLVGEEVGGEGQLIGYISQSSCHSLNTGSDSDKVSYHMVNEFDRDRHMDQPLF